MKTTARTSERRRSSSRVSSERDARARRATGALRAAPIALLIGCFACAAPRTDAASSDDLPRGAQTRSRSGEILFAPPLDAAERSVKEAARDRAKARVDAEAENPDAWIEWGRRTAALGLYRESVAIYSRAIGRFPDDARLWRHRGHRMITLRMPELALADLEHAAELAASHPDEPEPPLDPNARGVVIDTLKENIYYHLGIAHYLQGDFSRASDAFYECLRYADNPDGLCMATHWLYMSLRRMGRDEQAKGLLASIDAKLDVIEYHAYHQLCLMYKGELDPERLLASASPTGKSAVDFATLAYGVGNWYLCNGDADRARAIFQRAANAEMWAAFGRIASEYELARGVQR
jgi:tetratricopeptide (TPR) repeat protein